MRKVTTLQMEIVIADYFNPRTNLVVPNVSWGFLEHEADLLIMSKSGYLTEVEIKVSLSDLKADAKKNHCHESDKIKYLYFAIPEYLAEKAMEHIPERAGILVVSEYTPRKMFRHTNYKQSLRTESIRMPKQNGSYKLSIDEKFQIARLGSLRIFGLKKKIQKLINKEQ